jgi:hypothetical protein
MDVFKGPHGFGYTRLHAHIVEEDGAFTVRVRMLNHLKQEQLSNIMTVERQPPQASRMSRMPIKLAQGMQDQAAILIE